MLYVKKANLEDIEKEWAFVRDMPEDENGLTNTWHGISREDFEKSALPDMLRFERGENLPDWMVPETFLFLWEDEKIVGQFRIRHYLNDALREGGGHIGQFIAKEYRGKGYGKGLMKEIAKIIIERDYGRFEWTAVSWNEPAIDFYLSIGAEQMDWELFHLDGDDLKKLADL